METTEEAFAKEMEQLEAQESLENEETNSNNEEVVEAEVKAEETEVVEESPDVVPRDQYDNIHRAMDRERAEKRELQQQFEEYKLAQSEKLARLDERMNTIWGGEEEPEPEDKVQTLEEKLNAQEEQLKKMQMANALNSQESEFAARTPDYTQAKEHYFKTRQESLTALGYSEEDVQKQIISEVAQFSGTALQSNQNAAERLYQAAQRVGYVPVTKAAEERLGVIEEGLTDQKLPPGAPPEGELTLEALANMSDAEFAKIPEEKVRTLMGG